MCRPDGRHVFFKGKVQMITYLHYNALYSKKETLQNTYKSAEKEINALNRKLDNLKQYLDRDSQDHQTSDRKAERNQNTL